MRKFFLFSFFILFVSWINVFGQTGTKLDMLGASAVSLVYDENIIVNVDFSNGYTDWQFDIGSGGYHIRYDGVSNPGDIQVGRNPAMFNKYGFNTYGDHTSNNGFF